MNTQQREHALGNGRECAFPKCKATMPRQRGVPCQEEHCPECGARMLRAGSRHELLLQRTS